MDGRTFLLFIGRRLALSHAPKASESALALARPYFTRGHKFCGDGIFILSGGLANRDHHADNGERSAPSQAAISKRELLDRSKAARAWPRDHEGSILKEYGLDFLFEFWRFMRQRKKFWLLPIFLMMVVFGGLVVLTKGSVVAPFIYTLF
jgi:hypothetical protein